MSLSLDRRYPGIGRIHRRIGSSEPRLLRRVQRALDAAFADARLDILRAVRDGSIELVEVAEAYGVGDWGLLPVGAVGEPLCLAWKDWMANRECSESYRATLAQTLRVLEKHHPTARIMEAGAVLTELRVRYADRQVTFNRMKAHFQAFAKARVGRSSTTYAKMRDILKLRAPHKNPHHAWSVQEIDAVAGKLKERARDALWGLAATGMRWSEYAGKWELGMDRVLIYGTKTAGAVRVIPLVTGYALRPCRIGYQRFRMALGAASSGEMMPHDTRHSFAVWMADCEVPRHRRAGYMGHGASNIGDLYEFHERADNLAIDAEKINRYISERRKPLELVSDTA